MARGLDHIVHAVRDLDAVATLYRKLGFLVGARNAHHRAWGTRNHIIQFSGTFIELLTVADASGIEPHTSRTFSFGAYNRDFLNGGEGLSMLVLQGLGAPTQTNSAQEKSAISKPMISNAKASGPTARRSRLRSRSRSRVIRKRQKSDSSPASIATRRTSGIRPFRCIPTRPPA